MTFVFFTLIKITIIKKVGKNKTFVFAKSGTKIAYDYALRQNKIIINLFE